jgi:hypothetical protein
MLNLKIKHHPSILFGYFFWTLLTMVIFSVVGLSAPTPGRYELYNKEGQKTGDITCSLTELKDEAVTLLTVQTSIDVPKLTGSYKFNETDDVRLDKLGVVSFRRVTDDDGKKSFVMGDRVGSLMKLIIQREDQKLSLAVPLSSFDITEFELDLPHSKFYALKPGENKAQRVLMMDMLRPVVVARNISDIIEVPFNDKKRKVLLTYTLIGKKTTQSWFDASTHELLQEEGPQHLLSRVTDQ